MAHNSFFNGIGGLFGDIARAHNASRMFSELQTLSDTDLARRGLTREDIARHVVNHNFG